MKTAVRKENLGTLLEMNGALNKARRLRTTYRYYIRPVRKESPEGGKPRTS
ncbi:MAG: hypothetical protein P9M00_10610 [Candidatus Tritonobacter lacicola]|nr:hypothetical protein [Candidatus Tritonobacter lacicola]